MNFKEFRNIYQKAPIENYSTEVPSDPVVSVCVQTYQHADYIKDCLDGILMQETEFPIEVLVGEDASSDGTRDICIEYAKRYPKKIRLFLHRRENNIAIRGKPTGRFNFLYNMYNTWGKYIALCEGDDYWTDPLKLQKQVKFLEENEKYYGCITNRIKNNLMAQSQTKSQYPTIISKGDILGGFVPPLQCLMFRREIAFDQHVKFKGHFAGDRILSYLITLKGPIYCLNDITAVYNYTGKGTWSNFHNFNQNVLNAISLKHFHDLAGLPKGNKYIVKRMLSIVKGRVKGNNELSDKEIKARFEINSFQLIYIKWRLQLSILKNRILREV